MATVAPPADKASELLQKLSLDSQTKTLGAPEATKKASVIKYGSVDGGNANGPIQSFERSTTPLIQDFMDPTMCYLPNGYPSTAYYYGAYDGCLNEWDEYSNGVEIPPGVYGDNGSLMYHHGYGYAPYGTYPLAGSPVPALGHDGQLYGPQHYQYTTPFYQPQTPPSGPYPKNQASNPQGEVPTSIAADQVPLPLEASKGNGNGIRDGNVKGNNGPTPVRPSYHNSFLNSNGSVGRGVLPAGTPPPTYQDPRFCFDGVRSPLPWLDGSIFPDGQLRPATSSSFSSTVSHISNISSGRSQNLRPLPHLMGLHSPRPASPGPGFMNGMYQNNSIYSQNGNTVRSGASFGSNGYNSRSNGHGWLAIDGKNKPRGRGNGVFSYDNESMTEINRGPRGKGFKNQNGFTTVTLAVKGQPIFPNGNNNVDEKKDISTSVPDRESYNREEFPEKYSDAKFFIIKSYSEDDIHKSIKYSMWASTPNGNKKLDNGYKEAQENSGDCPVFLFFSVNSSGQFVGLAEMVGPVDFNKNLEYWQQDKWNGCFPVKWHIVKDIPNSLLKHITLENNDNKPVTNSRDTQEVRFEHGLQVLKIFKDHSSKTCILDDFAFYEDRQKTMQEKRAKQQQFQKQVWDRKSNDTVVNDEKDKEGLNGNPILVKSLEVVAALAEEPIAKNQINEEQKLSEKSIGAVVDVAKGA